VGWGLFSKPAAAALTTIVAWVGLSSAVLADVNPQGDCWIDVRTGAFVDTYPYGADPREFYNSTPENQYGNRLTGRNFAKLPDGSWIDTGTGQAVSTFPVGADPREFYNSTPENQYGNRLTGRNFARVPCPQKTASSTGLYLGGELVKNWGWVRSTERFATTDLVTNQFSDRADPVGGGLIVGYKFAPWAGNIVVSPFASFDFLHAPVNHTFPGGSYLGTTANFMGTAGVKVGPQLGMGLWLYGIAGVSVLNETLNVNFLPVASSSSATVPGATVGFGGAWQPSFLQGLGHPVSLFLEYQHTWWQSANFNTPTASPFFNYNFARQDDVVKFGFTVSLGAPSAAPVSSPMFVKALPAK